MNLYGEPSKMDVVVRLPFASIKDYIASCGAKHFSVGANGNEISHSEMLLFFVVEYGNLLCHVFGKGYEGLALGRWVFTEQRNWVPAVAAFGNALHQWYFAKQGYVHIFG